VNGPPLHLNAAQGPLVVLQVGAASQHAYFAWGGPGGGQSVDVRSDGGKHWWRAILGAVVMAVVASEDGRLIAFAQVPANSTSSTAVTSVYVSTDGGRHWHYSTASEPVRSALAAAATAPTNPPGVAAAGRPRR
jgi:hypothetical protein